MGSPVTVASRLGGMARGTLLCLVLAVSLAQATGCEGKKNDSAQALRRCVDRWNQANMVGWGPAFVNISVRRLDATELAAAGLRNAAPRCVVSFAFESHAAPGSRCPGGSAVPGKPRWCIDRTGTFACALNPLGAYACPPVHEPLGPPLTKKNATTDTRGVLTLDAPLRGTDATPPLLWHRRYPHTDGWIDPWTGASDLRPGLAFAAKGHGPCFLGSEKTHLKTAMSCRSPCNGGSELKVDRQSAVSCGSPAVSYADPCFPSKAEWGRGDVAACGQSPGATTFVRWVIAGRL